MIFCYTLLSEGLHPVHKILVLITSTKAQTKAHIHGLARCNIAAVTIDRVQWEHWNSPKLGEHLVPTSDLIVPT